MSRPAPEALIDHLGDLHTPRPLEEWDEEDGPVLWWEFPIQEAPYVGTPHDTGHTVEIEVTVLGRTTGIFREVGGWPGYHTHWTPLPSARKIQDNYVPEPAAETE